MRQRDILFAQNLCLNYPKTSQSSDSSTLRTHLKSKFICGIYLLHHVFLASFHALPANMSYSFYNRIFVLCIMS